MKDLRPFPKVAEMYGDKSEESDKGSEVFSCYLIAAEIGVGCCQMSEAMNITIFYLYEIIGKNKFHMVLLHNSVAAALSVLKLFPS